MKDMLNLTSYKFKWIFWGLYAFLSSIKYAESDDNYIVCHCCYICGVGLTVVLEQ